jgi:hypothetical protein
VTLILLHHPVRRSCTENGVPRWFPWCSIDAEKVALGMDLAEPIAVLRLALNRVGIVSTPPATARIIAE